MVLVLVSPGHHRIIPFKLMSSLEILFFLFSVFPLINAQGACPVSRCGSNGSTIGFPFFLVGQGQQHQNYCGYPGFNLRCRGPGRTALRLPNWGEFFVRGIDYVTQEIQLYDPDNCLPKRLLAFNLTDSPFTAEYYQNYTFLSCPSETTRSRFTAIDCLSNSTTSVLATSSMTLASKMSSCRILTTVAVPVSWPVQNEEEFSSDLSSDLQLTWDVPSCGDCRVQGGSCGFLSNSSLEVGCFPTENRSKSSGSLNVFRIISLSITLPAIIGSLGISLFICFTGRGPDWSRINAAQQIAATLEAPREPAVVMGLDESTIESYTKVVLGESRRVPGINDNTCSICLSEYCTKETLRCIPDCRHCFHAECIDEWLRVNGTCPVCRNSLSPVHVN